MTTNGLDPKTLPLTLTGMELVFLIDTVRNTDIAEGLPDAEAKVPLARALLLKMGSVYTELVKDDGILDGPSTFHVTEDEAWLLRGKVKTGDMGMDRKDVGTGLLIKLYALLLELNSPAPEFDLVVDVDDPKWLDFMGTKRGHDFKNQMYLDPRNDTPRSNSSG